MTVVQRKHFMTHFTSTKSLAWQSKWAADAKVISWAKWQGTSVQKCPSIIQFKLHNLHIHLNLYMVIPSTKCWDIFLFYLRDLKVSSQNLWCENSLACTCPFKINTFLTRKSTCQKNLLTKQFNKTPVSSSVSKANYF